MSGFMPKRQLKALLAKPSDADKKSYLPDTFGKRNKVLINEINTRAYPKKENK